MVKKEGFKFKSTQQILLKIYINWFQISSTCGPGRKGAGHGQRRGGALINRGKKDWRDKTPLEVHQLANLNIYKCHLRVNHS